MKRLLVSIVGVLWLIFLVYLLLPAPEIPPLPDSLKSTEPGDTVQIPGVSAYYTDYRRAEVVKFYQDSFSKFSFLELPLFQIKLNHPIEYSREVIKNPFLASYVEEIVHPFRESLIIAGWEPVNAPAQFYNENDRLPIIVGEKEYYAKATLRIFNSNILARIFIFGLTTISVILVYRTWSRILTREK